MKYSTDTENFFDKVYGVTKLIPYGRVTSYGAIAKYLGAARSSRMVGWAMNGAGKHPDVPAHRVVNRVGLLTGKMHFGSSNAMEQMLAEEGIKVEDDKIVNFKKYFWDPVVELGMDL
jgi:methylated-DNA-protein-cysteine methyltransferase-like protein